MDNRLKQIWSGFKAETTRHLTDRGVDNIVVPHRTNYAQDDRALLPEGFDAPAEAAFTALHEKLKSQEKRFRAKKRRRSVADDGPAPMETQSFNGEELVKGLKATALRTERPERDYTAFLGTNAGKAVLKKNRKKRFGIF